MIDDAIFDMDDALEGFEREITIKTVTETTVDFKKQPPVVTPRQQLCVVQPANPDKLVVENVDASLEYLTVHSRSNINLYEYIEFDGKDYKVITPAKWRGYGFCKVVAEETRKPLLEATP